MNKTNEMPPTTERKEFFASNIRNIICATCLSEDRELYAIKDLPQFANLCSGVELTAADHICWECRASLSNILKFQTKATYALSCLLYMEENFQPGTNKFMVYNLSNLDTKLNTTFDAEFIQLFDEEQMLDELLQMTREDASDDDCLDNIEELPDLSHYPVICDVMSIATNQQTDDFCIPSKESENIESSVIDVRNGIVTTDEDTDDQSEIIDEDKIQINIMGYKMMMLHRKREKRKIQFASSAMTCTDCIKTFDSYKSKQKHMKVHSKRAGPYMCSICSARFKHPDALASHIKKHYSYYTCRACTFTTFHLPKMVQHRVKYCDNIELFSNHDEAEFITAKNISDEGDTAVHNDEINNPHLMITNHDHCYYRNSGVGVVRNSKRKKQRRVPKKHIDDKIKENSKSLLKQNIEQELNVQILGPSEDPAQVEDDPMEIEIGNSDNPENNFNWAGFDAPIGDTFTRSFKMFVSRLDV